MGALSELPRELVIGWAFWLVGGLLLTLWFVRQSSSPRPRDVAPMAPSTGGPRLSGTHVAARSLSGTHATARSMSGTHAAVRQSSASRPVAVQPVAAQTSGLHGTDVFDELRSLLDAPEDSSRVG